MVPFRKNNAIRRDDLFSPFNDLQGRFKVDLKETDETYIVEADLHGIKKEAIDIEFNNNYLVVSAKRDESIEDKKENYVSQERHYGEFKQSFYIDNVDESKIDASFNDGVLKVTLPKLNKRMGNKRKIDIH